MCGRFAQAMCLDEILEIVESKGIEIDKNILDEHNNGVMHKSNMKGIDESDQKVHSPEHNQSSAHNWITNQIKPTSKAESKDSRDTKSARHAEAKKSLNIAPHDDVYVYVNSNGVKGFKLMNWAFLPSFKNSETTTKHTIFNTRSESISSNSPKHKFNHFFECAKHQRGIVFMQGYYEWQRDGKNIVPYYIKDKSEKLLCALAIWSNSTFSIITMPAAQDLRYIHDRMPVIIDFNKEDISKWVDDDYSSSMELIKPKIGLESYIVSSSVNKVGIEKPGMNLPIKQTDVLSFFKKRGADTIDKEINKKKTKTNQ